MSVATDQTLFTGMSAYDRTMRCDVLHGHACQMCVLHTCSFRSSGRRALSRRALACTTSTRKRASTPAQAAARCDALHTPMSAKATNGALQVVEICESWKFAIEVWLLPFLQVLYTSEHK